MKRVIFKIIEFCIFLITMYMSRSILKLGRAAFTTLGLSESNFSLLCLGIIILLVVWFSKK